MIRFRIQSSSPGLAKPKEMNLKTDFDQLAPPRLSPAPARFFLCE
jgi:hypothetical protein